MSAAAQTLRPPSRTLMFLEGRAIHELGALLGALPLLSLAPRGDGHPVLVLPGLIASDVSTRPLRAFLRNRGYAVSGWRQGRNLGLRPGVQHAMTDLLDVSEGLTSNGINRQFLFVPGPAFGNSNPIVSYPNSLSSFPTGAGGTPSLVVFAPNFRSPYVEQGNVQIEHQFAAHTALSVGYVYTHGLRLLGNSNGGCTRIAASRSPFNTF